MSGIFKISAAMALPLAFVISMYFFQNKKDIVQTVQICSVTAPKGHISKCVLPDGTEVWVNTGSTITYNTSAFNKDTREIHLEGEAYFQVKSGHEKLFRVTTPIADLKVTGTSFNVKAYQGSGIFETVLDEGSINIQLNNRSGQAVLLEPGERAVYDINRKNIQIAHVDTKMYSCWRNGEILFKDATLNDLVVELERIYEIKFNFRDENLRRYRFRGMFSYNNNLIDALEKIKKTAGIAYYIENKEAWLSK